MPHDRQFTTLFHPDQALTAEQAAGWVTDLIDYYSQSVGALYHDTLPEEALPGYMETLRSLLECAGALEQHLCGMCFFLPNQLSRTVVAIIVASYYQSALLDAFIDDPKAGACLVVDVETLEDMNLYLWRVSAYIDSLRDWLMSERYTMLQGAAKKAVFEMRNRIVSATGSPGRDDTPPYVARNPMSTRAKSKAAEVPFASLDLFLRRLCPDHFLDEPSSASTSRTLVLSFETMDPVTDPSRVAGPSSPTTATPSPFPMPLPELGLNHQDLERRPSLTSSDTTCVEESILGSPFHLKTKVYSSPKEIAGQSRLEPAPDAPELQPSRTSRKRRRRTVSTFESSSSSSQSHPESSSSSAASHSHSESSSSSSHSHSEDSHPRKRHKKLSLRTFSSRPGDAEYVGRAVPVRDVRTGCSSAAMTLPPRNLSASPSASQTSAALRAKSLSPLGLGLALDGVPPPSQSAEGVPSVWIDRGEGVAATATHASMLLEPDWRYGMRMHGIEVEVDAELGGGESDDESFTTADVGMEDGCDVSRSCSRAEQEMEMDADKDHDDAPIAPSRVSPPPPPVLSSKATGKRRCFTNIFSTFRHIFNGR